MSHHRETIQAAGAPAAAGPYSHAVVSGGFLFCSGQTPLDPATGELVGGGIGDQAARCLENLSIICAAAGTALADAVRISVYVTDMSTFSNVNEAYAKFFESEPPARTTIGVAALPLGAQVEMDAIVALSAE
ncbi:MAG: RidA family protein [Solirubrobacterales bacterium]|nr:RidA family protein [Solirubrobacterales bacterium]